MVGVEGGTWAVEVGTEGEGGVAGVGVEAKVEAEARGNAGGGVEVVGSESDGCGTGGISVFGGEGGISAGAPAAGAVVASLGVSSASNASIESVCDAGEGVCVSTLGLIVSVLG